MYKMEKKHILVMLFLFVSKVVLSQFNHVPIAIHQPGAGLKDFKFKGQFYSSKPKGLEKFIKDSKVTGSLKNELIHQMKIIKRKEIIGTVGGWGGFVGAIVYGFTHYDGSRSEKMSQGDILKSAGIFALGGLIEVVFGAKKKHYYKFFNTYNKERKNKINISFNANYTKQFNYGLAINF